MAGSNESGRIGAVLGGLAAVGAGIVAVVKWAGTGAVALGSAAKAGVAGAGAAVIVAAPIVRSADEIAIAGMGLAHAAPSVVAGAEGTAGALGAGDDLARALGGLGDEAAGLSVQSRQQRLMQSLPANPGDDGALSAAGDDTVAAGSAEEGGGALSRSVDATVR